MRQQADFDDRFCEIVAPVHDELAAMPIIIDEAIEHRLVRCISRLLIRGTDIGPKTMGYVQGRLSAQYGLASDQIDDVIDRQMVRQLETVGLSQKEVH